MATIAEMRVRLVEAENAYHQLMTGTAMVECRDANGEHARYTTANASRLKLYITWLKEQINQSPNKSASRPLRPIFG